MSSAVPPRRRRDAAGTRQRLLHAARRRFAVLGYERTTLRDIAADAGVNLALIKRYFDSKEGLFAASLASAPELGSDLEADLRVRRPRDAAEIARIFSENLAVASWPEFGEHPIMLFLRGSGDARIDAVRREGLASFAERLLNAVGVEPEDVTADARLRAQLLVALGAGVVVLRSAVGIQPLADATAADLAGPLTDIISATLPAPAGPGERAAG